MGRKRMKLASLAHLLDASVEPLYLLDDEFRIVFCNRALLDWVGCGADDLLGRQCRYGAAIGPGRASGDDAEDARLDRIASGLCPPPDAIGAEVRAIVASLDEKRWMRRRLARFTPLRTPDDQPNGILVVVETSERTDSPHPAPIVLPADPPPILDDDATRLHEELRAFHAERAARYRVERFVGRSAAMRRARSQVLLAAGSRVSVSIHGPPGSGRQHAAHAIHYGGPDAAPGALFPVDCAVLDADLIESTIRALAARDPSGAPRGLGTLLLADVDLLPKESFRTLAAAFGDGRFPRRVVSTSRRPLAEYVREGTMRPDLAAMLSVVEIALPPLTARQDDVPLLAQAFVEQCNARGDKQLAGLTSDALDLLDIYHWPGEVEELSATIEAAHASASGVRIGVEDLPERLHYALDAAATPRRATERIDLDAYLADIERRLIARALELSKGNRSKAAELLGLNRPRLYRRMEQLGLE